MRYRFFNVDQSKIANWVSVLATTQHFEASISMESITTRIAKADFIVTLPENKEIVEFSENGSCLLGLSEDNVVIQHIDNFLAKNAM